MAETKDDLINYEELEQHARELATPIDFDALIEAGIIEKHGAWYKILKKDELPTHVNKKIYKVKTSDKGTLVQFRKPSKRLAKYFKM